MTCLPVLMYHHVAEDREVTPAQFEAQLEFLKKKGYRTPGLAEAADLVAGRREAEGRLVMLTFDDGYADNWICAWPLLKKYGFRAVVFPVTARLGASDGVRPTLADGAASPDTLTDERGPAGFLTRGELKAMTASGVFEAGSHTHTHKDFLKRARYADVGWELETSARLIGEQTGRRPSAVAWPWGQQEPQWRGAAAAAGFKLAFTTVTGVNRPGADPLRLKRIKVADGSIGWFRSRLLLHGLPAVSQLYGGLYGMDRRVKSALGLGGPSR